MNTICKFSYNAYTTYRSYLSILAFNSSWNRFVERKHPSIWVFLSKLKDQEKLTRLQITAAERGI